MKQLEELEKKYQSLMDQLQDLYLSNNQDKADKLYHDEVIPLAKKINYLQEKQIREILN